MTLHEMALSGVSNACRSHDECFSSHEAADQFTPHKTKVKYQVHKFSTSRQTADTKEFIKSGHKSGHFGTPELTSTQHKSAVYARKHSKGMDEATLRDDRIVQQCLAMTGEDLSTSNHSACQMRPRAHRWNDYHQTKKYLGKAKLSWNAWARGATASRPNTSTLSGRSDTAPCRV